MENREKYYQILEDTLHDKKVDIDGKGIEVTGQEKRIREIESLAVEKGFDIPEKSIKHYAKHKGGIEYVLVRW